MQKLIESIEERRPLNIVEMYVNAGVLFAGKAKTNETHFKMVSHTMTKTEH